MGFLGTADYVGLACLVQGPPRPNALVAQGRTRILYLPAKSLEALISTEPDLGMRLFRSVAEHLSQTLMAQEKRESQRANESTRERGRETLFTTKGAEGTEEE